MIISLRNWNLSRWSVSNIHKRRRNKKDQKRNTHNNNNDLCNSTTVNNNNMKCWQEYLERCLVSTGLVQKAAIIGWEDERVTCWAKSHPEFHIDNHTVSSLIETMNLSKSTRSGVKKHYSYNSVEMHCSTTATATDDLLSFEIDGTIFIPLSIDDNCIYAKSLTCNNNNNNRSNSTMTTTTTATTKYGCAIIKCNSCILVATYTDSANPGAANMTVGRIGQFLIDKGY